MMMPHRTWYITLIAAFYLIFCSIACIYYVSLHLIPDAGTVPWSTQLLCLGAALSAAAYFINPFLGHRALIIITLLTLFAIGESDLHATQFHLFVLVLLLLPIPFRQQRAAA
jgi:hypothetical protein